MLRDDMDTKAHIQVQLALLLAHAAVRVHTAPLEKLPITAVQRDDRVLLVASEPPYHIQLSPLDAVTLALSIIHACILMLTPEEEGDE